MKRLLYAIVVIGFLFLVGTKFKIVYILGAVGLILLMASVLGLWIIKHFGHLKQRQKNAPNNQGQPQIVDDDSTLSNQLNDIEKPNYRRKHLLTKNEWAFYKKLKPIADRYNLHVLSKIRMADLVEPVPGNDKSTWYRDFAKIKAKHVDFALANPDNLYILLLIELDDLSHLTPTAAARDNFVDLVYGSVGIPILHIDSTDKLEDDIVRLLNLEKKESNIEK